MLSVEHRALCSKQGTWTDVPFPASGRALVTLTLLSRGQNARPLYQIHHFLTPTPLHEDSDVDYGQPLIQRT